MIVFIRFITALLSIMRNIVKIKINKGPITSLGPITFLSEKLYIYIYARIIIVNCIISNAYL